MADKLMSAIKESNAAPSGASKSEDHMSPWECGYNVVEAEPTTPLVQSEVPGQGEAIGAENDGAAVRSYSFQSPTLSATSGMPASKK